jgi:hypothetical protein
VGDGLRATGKWVRRRSGTLNVGVVRVVRGELWNWSTSECYSLSSFVGGDDITGPLVVSMGCQFVGISM